MKYYRLFKITYVWYEGDEGETILCKNVEQEEFEKDLVEAKDFAQSLIKNPEIREGEWIGKGYRVNCLPEYYEQIIWFLTNKRGYKDCLFDEDTTYNIDDGSGKKIKIIRSEKTIKNEDIK